MRLHRLITSDQLSALGDCDGMLGLLALVQGAMIGTLVTMLVQHAPAAPAMVLAAVLSGSVWPQARLWQRRARLVEALPVVEVTSIDGEPCGAEENACVH